jgi:hypothetical protein
MSGNAGGTPGSIPSLGWSCLIVGGGVLTALWLLYQKDKTINDREGKRLEREEARFREFYAELQKLREAALKAAGNAVLTQAIEKQMAIVEKDVADSLDQVRKIDKDVGQGEKNKKTVVDHLVTTVPQLVTAAGTVRTFVEAAK